MGGKELYEAFMKKLKSQHHMSIREKNQNKEKMIEIEIPLRGAKGQAVVLDEAFIKVIQHEYAVRYLEQLRLKST